MNDISNEYSEILPDDTKIRTKLKKKSKNMNYLGWIISIIAIFLVVVFWSLDEIWIIFILFGVFVSGQGIRMYGNALKGRANNAVTAYSKKQMKSYVNEQDQIVRDYFNQNEDIAQKVVNMNNLAKKGKFKDAKNIGKSILRKNPPPPKRVKIFIEGKMKNYSSNL